MLGGGGGGIYHHFLARSRSSFGVLGLIHEKYLYATIVGIGKWNNWWISLDSLFLLFVTGLLFSQVLQGSSPLASAPGLVLLLLSGGTLLPSSPGRALAVMTGFSLIVAGGLAPKYLAPHLGGTVSDKDILHVLLAVSFLFLTIAIALDATHFVAEEEDEGFEPPPPAPSRPTHGKKKKN